MFPLLQTTYEKCSVHSPLICQNETMEARSGQNHDNEIALQVNFNPTAANVMDLLCIFVINKQYLFQRVSNYF